ncbi:tRNA lysidine(34) synthetase TilS [Roseivirga sp. 4D4]|uniref:tRNA lysidine(34) synthetase TilS n=1 Tax=Roseivirga sp. 4D4 TaxID=1889784 RepID=UPI000852A691|nr:tRNA lysidine(34) synthetase TilS [Roseivirga sp. 4D4]OEK01453.1 tRNA lysidine(34) synthetase TilS [Roseivirga sp. 4D4]
MHKRFLQFIKKHALNVHEHKYLLAISGGVDSMVLWHLAEQSDVNYSIAHCNFQLRGEASDRDQSFIEERAKGLGRQFHSKRFDTESYATLNKVSTQMAARELRYAWFDELCSKEGYQKIFLAHHANDDVETFLLNMIRGTSIKGLTGMDSFGEKLVRPLLDASKEEIMEFAISHDILWREDSSNAEVYYKRNFIRKEIIPKLETLNPDFLTTMKRNMVKNMEVARLADLNIEKLKAELLEEIGDGFSIRKRDLTEQEIGPYVLSEFLKEFGFNYYQCEEIISGLSGISGKVFKSPSYELLVDREVVHIRHISTNFQEELLIELGDVLSVQRGEYKVWIYDDPNQEIDQASSNAMLDLDKLKFPLVLRKWNEGDRIQPLGMTGQKLVSDLLIDSKLSRFEKQSVHVLCSEGEVVWVVGLRISDKFKVDKDTKSILHYQLADRV